MDTLVIMQPYFFPYLGHFRLIAESTRWLVFDTAQHVRRGWVQRNRILHPVEGWQFINLPLEKHSRETNIEDLRVANGAAWQEKLIRQIQHYRKDAPHFASTQRLIEHCLSTDTDRVARLNISILQNLCGALDLPFSPVFATDLDVDPGASGDPGERILTMCLRMGASRYLNPAGGESLLSPERFSEAGIRLSIQRYEGWNYATGSRDPVPSLSIIDALMWNGIQAVRRHLVTSLD